VVGCGWICTCGAPPSAGGRLLTAPRPRGGPVLCFCGVTGTTKRCRSWVFFSVCRHRAWWGLSWAPPAGWGSHWSTRGSRRRGLPAHGWEHQRTRRLFCDITGVPTRSSAAALLKQTNDHAKDTHAYKSSGRASKRETAAPADLAAVGHRHPPRARGGRPGHACGQTRARGQPPATLTRNGPWRSAQRPRRAPSEERHRQRQALDDVVHLLVYFNSVHVRGKTACGATSAARPVLAIHLTAHRSNT